jgi:hypothetical protein
MESPRDHETCAGLSHLLGRRSATILDFWVVTPHEGELGPPHLGQPWSRVAMESNSGELPRRPVLPHAAFGIRLPYRRTRRPSGARDSAFSPFRTARRIRPSLIEPGRDDAQCNETEDRRGSDADNVAFFPARLSTRSTWESSD